MAICSVTNRSETIVTNSTSLIWNQTATCLMQKQQENCYDDTNLIWHQMEKRLVPHQSVKCNYNPKLVSFDELVWSQINRRSVITNTIDFISEIQKMDSFCDNYLQLVCIDVSKFCLLFIFLL